MSDASRADPSPLMAVGSRDDLAGAVRSLGRDPAGSDGRPRRALLLIGGADFTDPGLMTSLGGFFANLTAWCESTGTAVVDGGTDSGVMRLAGEARHAIEGSFSLVGVAPGGALDRSASSGSPIDPARGHSLVILTPGERFGDETEWLFAVADELGGGHAPTIVVNGGKLSMEEALLRLEGGDIVVAITGSGRAADELAARAAEDGNPDPDLRTLPVDARPDELAGVLEGAMTAGRRPPSR